MRVAAVQMSSGGQKAANIAAADAMVRAAAADGANLILLPEKWTAIGGGEILRAAAEEIGGGGEVSGGASGVSGVADEVSGGGTPGSALDWARSIASELRIDLVAGSITERQEGESRLSNTSIHVSPDGEVKALYRKIHMFDVEVEGRLYRESEHERPGEEIVVSETACGVSIGMSICYDVRFPELYRILTLRGAKILLVPAAFTLATTREHWEVLLRARAIENQAFVVAADQFGQHPDGYHSGGRSMIVDPWGVVLAQAADRECHVVADLDLDQLEQVRRRLPSLANRRPGAYAWPEAGEREAEARPLRPEAGTSG